MIDGVKVKDLTVIPDERGLLMEMWRSDDPDFEKFGQVYVTMVYPGVVEGVALPQEADRPLRVRGRHGQGRPARRTRGLAHAR